MTALAAARLGYRCTSIPRGRFAIAGARRRRPCAAAPTTTRPPSPASRPRSTSSPTSSRTCPRRPSRPARALKPVRPGVRPIHVAQHRLREKNVLPQARHRHGRLPADRERWPIIAAATALPGILKTCTEGYDGKGQARVRDRAALAAAWEKLGQRRVHPRGAGRFPLRGLGHRRARPRWRDALLSRSG